MKIDLQLADTAGWRALLTQAQQHNQAFLPDPLEQYAVALLYRSLGSASNGAGLRATHFARLLITDNANDTKDLAAVGDHCLLFSGLFPEHAMRQKIPVSYFVQVGRQAYRDHAARLTGSEREFFRALADHYVKLLDVLLTIREANTDRPCLDGLNAYQLWRETGSHHGWQVLRQLTPALPASGTHALH